MNTKSLISYSFYSGVIMTAIPMVTIIYGMKSGFDNISIVLSALGSIFVILLLLICVVVLKIKQLERRIENEEKEEEIQISGRFENGKETRIIFGENFEYHTDRPGLIKQIDEEYQQRGTAPHKPIKWWKRILAISLLFVSFNTYSQSVAVVHAAGFRVSEWKENVWTPGDWKSSSVDITFADSSITINNQKGAYYSLLSDQQTEDKGEVSITSWDAKDKFGVPCLVRVVKIPDNDLSFFEVVYEKYLLTWNLDNYSVIKFRQTKRKK